MDAYIADSSSSKSPKQKQQQHKLSKKPRRKYADDEAEEVNESEEDEEDEDEATEKVWPADLDQELPSSTEDEDMSPPVVRKSTSIKEKYPRSKKPASPPPEIDEDEDDDDSSFEARIELGSEDTSEGDKSEFSESDLSEHMSIEIRVPEEDKVYHGGYTKKEILKAWAKVSDEKPRAKYESDTKEDILNRTAKQMIAQGLLNSRRTKTKKRAVRDVSSSPEPIVKARSHPKSAAAAAAAESEAEAPPATTAAAAPRKKANKAESFDQVLERLSRDPAYPFVVPKVPKAHREQFLRTVRLFCLAGSTAATPASDFASSMTAVEEEFGKLRSALDALRASVTSKQPINLELPAGDIFIGTLDESGPVLKAAYGGIPLADSDYAAK